MIMKTAQTSSDLNKPVLAGSSTTSVGHPVLSEAINISRACTFWKLF